MPSPRCLSVISGILLEEARVLHQPGYDDFLDMYLRRHTEIYITYIFMAFFDVTQQFSRLVGWKCGCTSDHFGF
jgi:hypothetical protein